MKCIICKHGTTVSGSTTVTLERDKMTLVFKHIPADVCLNCDEAYVNEKISVQLLHIAEKAAKSGVQVDVREFASMSA